MAKYVFAYHGGGMPESEEEQAAVMAAWGAWMGGLGDALVDQGNPVGQTKTVASDGTATVGGGANPLSGYSLFVADNIDEAVAAAKGCPILEGGGSVEVSETIDM